MARITQTAVPMWKQQADATLDQAPVSGTKYTVLDTVKNARILSIVVKVTWTVQPTPLEIHVTIDGVPKIYKLTDPVSAQSYIASEDPGQAATVQALAVSFTTGGGTTPFLVPYTLEGKSVKIEAEITGGTVSNLSARVKYALRR